MTDTDGQGASRAQGPAVVWEGKPGSSTLLVLDPAGAAKHEDIPASWHMLAGDRQIVWCRLPADGSLSDAAELFADPSGLGAVDVITSAPVTDTVLGLVQLHPRTVRSLLLVDPGANGVKIAEAYATNRRWLLDNQKALAELAADGITVEVVAQSSEQDDDRVEPPMPLGHPDVVAGIERCLSKIDGL